MSQQIPSEISSFCQRCSERLSGTSESADRIELVRSELPLLLRNKTLFSEILCNLIEGAKYPDLRQATMFDNELLLYADPARLFSLRLFLWNPGDYTPVHDHNSWGVIGPVSGELDVTNYRREDEGSEDKHARLAETERLRLLPGGTAFTLPLNEGIHRIGNPTRETMLSLSVYGNPLPRGYINRFDIASGRVHRILPPKLKKQELAIQALPGLDRSVGHGTLERARNHPLEVIRNASVSSLKKLTHNGASADSRQQSPGP